MAVGSLLRRQIHKGLECGMKAMQLELEANAVERGVASGVREVFEEHVRRMRLSHVLRELDVLYTAGGLCSVCCVSCGAVCAVCAVC